VDFDLLGRLLFVPPPRLDLVDWPPCPLELDLHHQALEKAALTVVFSARRLYHYFQSFTVIVMTDLPIRKVLQKTGCGEENGTMGGGTF